MSSISCKQPYQIKSLNEKGHFGKLYFLVFPSFRIFAVLKINTQAIRESQPSDTDTIVSIDTYYTIH